MAFEHPVLIIGAGIVGLTFAHGLQKAGIPFQIFERDEHVDSRPQGWAMTLHWVMPFLKSLLDAEIYSAIDTTQVDPQVGRNDTGNFLFLNLATEEVKFKIPPNARRRVGRDRLRKLLLQDVKDRVIWSKRLSTIQIRESSVVAHFDDGSTSEGSLVVGADGTNSSTRKWLRPNSYQNYQLPVRMLGVGLDMSADEVAPLRELDPLLFQGCHPDTQTFMWYSILEVPETNGTLGTDCERYRAQVMLSWELKQPSDEVAQTNAGRLAQMKQKAEGFSPRLWKVFEDMSSNTTVTEVKLTDWMGEQWDNSNGCVTLAGDAAHAMVMYRGEAGNHAILDAYRLVQTLSNVRDGKMSQKQAIDEYEAELGERTRPAVLLSRQACIEAHDFDNLNANSAIMTRRAIPN